jgi:thiol-disulfide isomerase/thioredoxin
MASRKKPAKDEAMMTPLNQPFILLSALACFAAAATIGGCAPSEAPPSQAHSTVLAQPVSSTTGTVGGTAGRADATPAQNGVDKMERPLASKPDERGEGPGQSSAGEVTVRSVTPEQFNEVIGAQKGKVVLVDFWATYCLPCRAKFPKTLALSRKYAGQGLAVVSMSMDSPERKYQKEVIKFLQQQNSQIINLENGLDDTDAAFAALGIDGGALPHYKIFDRHGVLRKKFGGDPDHPFDEKDIETAVVAVLQVK